MGDYQHSIEVEIVELHRHNCMCAGLSEGIHPFIKASVRQLSFSLFPTSTISVSWWTHCDECPFRLSASSHPRLSKVSSQIHIFATSTLFRLLCLTLSELRTSSATSSPKIRVAGSPPFCRRPLLTVWVATGALLLHNEDGGTDVNILSFQDLICTVVYTISPCFSLGPFEECSRGKQSRCTPKHGIPSLGVLLAALH